MYELTMLVDFCFENPPPLGLDGVIDRARGETTKSGMVDFLMAYIECVRIAKKKDKVAVCIVTGDIYM